LNLIEIRILLLMPQVRRICLTNLIEIRILLLMPKARRILLDPRGCVLKKGLTPMRCLSSVHSDYEFEPEGLVVALHSNKQVCAIDSTV
jgi:hypothetical protein